METTMMFGIPFIAAICGGILASKKNRSVFGWVLLCLLFPLCIVILLCLSPLPAEGETPSQAAPLAPDEKICPYCAEKIKAAAVVCKHCRRDIPPAVIEVVQHTRQEK